MNEQDRRIKFRWITEVNWLRINPWDRDMYTRYTIWSSEDNVSERKILYEWMGGNVIPTNVYSKDEVNKMLKTWIVDGNDMNIYTGGNE